MLVANKIKVKGSDKETREAMIMLLHEMRRHKRYVLSEATCLMSPQIPRAMGELMAQDLASPMSFLGQVNFRLTKKGYSLIRDIPESELAFDQFGYVYCWRD